MAKEVELIKEKLNLVEFLRSYISLTPAGKNFKALCPFHSEKTPSFVVSPDRQIWHCFGACGEGGDIIKFAMKYENLEFGEALRFLAEKAGLSLESLGFREQREFSVLYDIHEVAKEFYKSELLKNKTALDYLKNRKLTDETITEFELGYAPLGETLHLYLIKKGFDVNDIVRAGLAQKNVRGLYRDRFQERIVFPISNHLGRVVAFTGRLFQESNISKNAEFEMPKYLNSPETPIFNKSKILYGLNQAKNYIGGLRTVFLVEGQMDLLSAWQAGVKNVVAVSGTGLTPHHLERLRHLADSIVISFDNDEAGLKALERSLDVFNSFDFHVKVIDLGVYKDPDEACRNEPTYLKQAIEWAKPAFEHLFRAYFVKGGQNANTIAAKKRIIRHLLDKIKNIKSAVEQDIWIKELARHSGISEMALMSELANLPAKKNELAEEKEVVSPNLERVDLIAERILALALLRREKFWPLLEARQDWLPNNYRAVVSNPLDENLKFFEMRASYEFEQVEEELLDKEFGDLINYLEIEFLKKERVHLKDEIKLAEDGNNEAELVRAMNKFNENAKRIDELNYQKTWTA